MKRNLSLKRETLSDLTPHELSIVVGADSGPACPVWNILRDNDPYPTIIFCRTV
jgi:hypothetical protein